MVASISKAKGQFRQGSIQPRYGVLHLNRVTGVNVKPVWSLIYVLNRPFLNLDTGGGKVSTTSLEDGRNKAIFVRPGPTEAL